MAHPRPAARVHLGPRRLRAEGGGVRGGARPLLTHLVTSPRDYKKKSNPEKVSVLRIRDAYPGSRIRIFAIPDAGSRLIKILDPGSLIRGRIKEFRYFNPKIVSKLSEK